MLQNIAFCNIFWKKTHGAYDGFIASCSFLISVKQSGTVHALFVGVRIALYGKGPTPHLRIAVRA